MAKNKFRVRYRRARVTVEGVKPCKCASCPATGRIELHHYFYAYKTSEVRKNPQLALEYTIGFCYQCHKIADMFRAQAQDILRAHAVNEVLLKEFLKKKGGDHAT